MKSLLAFLFSILGGVSALHSETILRNGDILEVNVGGAPIEFTQEFRLQYTVDDGVINVPIIGRLKAEGVSPTQLAAAIEKKFMDEKIFTKPSVIINMVTNQRFVVIGGAVRAPGRQLWTSDMTLSQAVMAAGGPSEWAKDSVEVVRGGKAEKYSRKAINKDPAKDPKILPGDFVKLAGDM